MRNYVNTARPLLLAAGIDDTETILLVADTTGYPDAPFTISLDRDTANEEVLLVTAKDATSFTVERGYDGTSNVSHSTGAYIEHVSSSIDYLEAGIPTATEAERDALVGDDLWDGRMIVTEVSGEPNQLEVYRGSAWEPVVPPGTLLPFAGTVAPNGWLLAIGQEVSRASYSRLFSAVGEAYGAGDGATTFVIPDMRGRFPLGVAAAGTGGTLGEAGGALAHNHSQPIHTHDTFNHTHSNPSLNNSSSHFHTQGNTGAASSHTHGTPDTGGADVLSEFGDIYSSGLLNQSDLAHNHGSHSHGSHSHSHSHGTLSVFGAHGEVHSGASTGSAAASSSMSSTTLSTHSPSRAKGHTHAQSNTGSGGSHSHSTANTNSGGVHSHTQGNTGSAGAGITSWDGGETTGSATPRYLALNYIIRV